MSKLALITGASRGIGKAIAHHFAKQGYSLILIARRENNLKQASDEIREKYQNTTVFTCAVDFSHPNEVEKTIQAILDEHVTPDVLVNSAGVLYPGNIELPVTKLNELITINMTSTITVSNLVAQKMKQQKHGRIYTIGSTTGLTPVTKIAAYSATKAAIVSYCQSLYQELLPYNIQVCCLCPSVVDTDMTNDGRLNNGDKIDTQDIVNAIQYIQSLSNAASSPVLPIHCKVIDLEKIS
ncbi:SDR family oxidoreductase [Vibrio sp. S4M6]|uniref:SDR family NAD(P)-dependent oxidoreductase n=1 Tax=Vibrio sinus TaxID=2946865 RepID=UPI002029BE1E|nr:SDR family oxidoreductase [Vibrio sinus]MCL9781930.1 SDR family oxidoreductase [Vibrio sinus]